MPKGVDLDMDDADNGNNQMFLYDDDDDVDDELMIDNVEPLSLSELPSVGSVPVVRYNYFSTSLNDLCTEPTTDCCVFFLCGCLLADRTAHVLRNHEGIPDSYNRSHHGHTNGHYKVTDYSQRTCAYVVIPLFLLGGLGMVTYLNTTTDTNDSLQAYRAVEILLIVALFAHVFKHLWGVWKYRSFLRHQLTELAARRDSVAFPSSSSLTSSSSSSVPLSCAHLCCGCVRRDTPQGHYSYYFSSNRSSPNLTSTGGNGTTTATSNNILTVTWKFVSNLCFGGWCGFCCCCGGCWIQCCGLCAIAQEARELRRLVPAQDLMIDYVTHEPFASYFFKIHRLRQLRQRSVVSHFRALSKLSSNLAKSLTCLLLFLLACALVNIQRGGEAVAEWVMLVATFLQSFFILYVVYWRHHRFHISLDAVIKYFASGFFLSVSMALLFEVVVQTAVGLLFALVIEATDVIEEEEAAYQSNVDNAYAADQYNNAYDDPASVLGVSTSDSGEDTDETIRKLLAPYEWGVRHFALVILGYFVLTFVVAATVEEVCKYCGFLMVDHPDFVHDPNTILSSRHKSNRTNQDDDEVELTDNNNHSNGTNDTNDNIDDNVAKLQEPSQSTQPSTSTSTSTIIHEHGSAVHRAQRVMLAMVAVAVGFACNENINYVFFRSGSVRGGTNVANEMSVLFQRSLFPIHPLCAALQSIGVVANSYTYTYEKVVPIGRILSPAIVVHGTFDFVVMVVPLLVMKPWYEDYKQYLIVSLRDGDDAAQQSPVYQRLQDAFRSANTAAMASAFAVTFLAVGYYLGESQAQHQRLQALDRERYRTLTHSRFV